jgi:hypothetical protein
MFKAIAALLSNRKTTSPTKAAPAKATSLDDRFRAHLYGQGYTENEAREILFDCYLTDKGIRYQQERTYPTLAGVVPTHWTIPASWDVLAGRPHVMKSWSEIFSRRHPPTETVPEFRARLRATGCTEAEISRSLVATTRAGIMMLRDSGTTLEQIMQMPAVHYLAKPTHPEAKKRYSEYFARPPHENGRLIWALTLASHSLPAARFG